MARFNDRYLHSIDPKGRLALSKDIRERFRLRKGEQVHLLPNVSQQPYLEIRTPAQWKSYQDSFMAQASSAQKRDFRRFVELMRETVKTDAQGRITIPARIREICKLGETVAVINMSTYIEVWNQEYVEQKFTDMVKAFRDINEQLF